MSEDIIKNKYGFYELLNKPSTQELDIYYSEKYYQDSKSSTYEHKYSNQEIQYKFKKILQKNLLIKEIIGSESGLFLDVGSGEGFALKYFGDLGWSCTGLDYSLFGIKTHNPDQKNSVIAGDIFKNLAKIIKKKKKFNLIWLDNVLEHVINPFQLMTDLRKILDERGVLVVEVPNDFSIIQKYLLSNNYINNKFWVCAPDHISYFNKEGLANLAKSSGWRVNNFISDYPIDWDLLNQKTNYIKDSSLGKNSHLRRVEIENLIHSISPEKANLFYEALSGLGLGRNITGFFTKRI
jgi:2-polyprenyl-3-methyl-5-hydroxy-6-metoxy-1,4-benzoquinol methylase